MISSSKSALRMLWRVSSTRALKNLIPCAADWLIVSTGTRGAESPRLLSSKLVKMICPGEPSNSPSTPPM